LPYLLRSAQRDFCAPQGFIWGSFAVFRRLAIQVILQFLIQFAVDCLAMQEGAETIEQVAEHWHFPHRFYTRQYGKLVSKHKGSS
jgi:hypothetical protein